MTQQYQRATSRNQRNGTYPRRSRQRSIFGTVSALKALGLSSFNRRLVSLAVYSFLSGLSQAGFLVVVSELAVSSAQGRNNLRVRTYSIPFHDSIFICIGLLVLFFASGIAAAFASSSMASAALEAGRGRIIDSFFTASWRIQSAERLGHVQQLLTVNCENIGFITLNISQGLQALLSVVALLLAAIFVNPLTAGIVLLAGIILSTAMRPFLKLSRKASTRLSNDSRLMATLVTEFSRLTREFRLLGVERAAINRLHTRNVQAATSYRKTRTLMQAAPTIYQSLAFAFVIAGLAILVGHPGKDLGATGAVLLLTLRSLTYGSIIQTNSQQLRSYEGFLDAIETDIQRYSESPHESQGGGVPDRFDIRFEGVSFSYEPEEEVLKGISFYVPSGVILGIVGRSGSGKSTLSELLLGMRAPSSGLALVGDVPAASMPRGNGSSPIALVAQESILLQGSIASNISFFRDVSQEQIENASRAAHLQEDIESMPRLYETLVGEGGGALSGGQRQRLAIARALIGAPRVLVLDEPTSALDSRSESLFRRTLLELRGRMTVVVISHRLATIEDCDLLLVLENGQLVDFGLRDEVVERAPFRNVIQTTGEDSKGSLVSDD